MESGSMRRDGDPVHHASLPIRRNVLMYRSCGARSHQNEWGSFVGISSWIGTKRAAAIPHRTATGRQHLHASQVIDVYDGNGHSEFGSSTVTKRLVGPAQHDRLVIWRRGAGDVVNRRA